MDSVVQPLVRVWRRLRCLAKNCHGGHAPRCWDCEPRSRSLPLAGLLEKRKPSGSAPCEVLLFHPASFLVPLATGGSLKVGFFFCFVLCFLHGSSLDVSGQHHLPLTLSLGLHRFHSGALGAPKDGPASFVLGASKSLAGLR